MITGGVKSNFSTVVIHPTSYDGCLALAALQQGMWVTGTSNIDVNYKAAKDQVKNFLLQDICFEIISKASRFRVRLEMVMQTVSIVGSKTI